MKASSSTTSPAWSRSVSSSTRAARLVSAKLFTATSLVDRVMLPDGQIVPVTDTAGKPDARAVAERVKSAASILQVSPRRVTLKLGEGDQPRLLLRPVALDHRLEPIALDVHRGHQDACREGLWLR